MRAKRRLDARRRLDKVHKYERVGVRHGVRVRAAAPDVAGSEQVCNEAPAPQGGYPDDLPMPPPGWCRGARRGGEILNWQARLGRGDVGELFQRGGVGRAPREARHFRKGFGGLGCDD